MKLKKDLLRVLHDLENQLPDLRQYELATVDVTESGPLEMSQTFFENVLSLFLQSDEDVKKRCQLEFVRTMEWFQRNGIKIVREDRGQQGTSLKIPSWTLTIDVNGQKFGVYTLGRVLVTELKKASL